jgi:hypothetical protein
MLFWQHASQQTEMVFSLPGVVVQSHKGLCDGVSALAHKVQSDRELTNLIRRKFAIKCTTGDNDVSWGGRGGWGVVGA